MPYTQRTQDFHFDVPENWTDRTMIAWSAPQVPGQPVTPNILIAYDTLGSGEDLADYVNRQIKELMSKAKRFQLDLRRDTELSGRPAIETIFHWESGSGQLKQRHIFSKLSEGRVIAFVNTAALADFDTADAQFLAILGTFGWDQAS